MIQSWNGQPDNMLNNYKILTVTHKHVRLERIGDFVITYADEKELESKLNKLKNQFGFDELLYVATCNRVIFFYYSSLNLNSDFSTSFFQAINPNLSSDYIQKTIRSYQGTEAIKHIYEVTSSIDSLVVGEREILRQIRDGFSTCENWGLIGDNIRLSMRYVVEAAKEVYAKTRIGEKQISVVSLAIHKLLQNNLARSSRILLIGAGQTNMLVSKFLVKYGFSNVTVFNRSIEKAQVLAERFNGVAFSLSELAHYEEGFDCMIVCTGATKAIINTSLYQNLIAGDTDKKLVVDLSIPNNVSKEVVNQFPIDYIEIEDLKHLADQNLSFRKQEITKAKSLLKIQITEFQKVFQQRQLTKALQGVPTEIKAIKEKAINEVFKKDLDDLDQATKSLVLKMMTYMEKKCISVPMKAAKTLVI